MPKKSGAFGSRKFKKASFSQRLKSQGVTVSSLDAQDFFEMLLSHESEEFTVPLDDDLINHMSLDSSIGLSLEHLNQMKLEGYVYCPSRQSFIAPPEFFGFDEE